MPLNYFWLFYILEEKMIKTLRIRFLSVFLFCFGFFNIEISAEPVNIHNTSNHTISVVVWQPDFFSKTLENFERQPADQIEFSGIVLIKTLKTFYVPPKKSLSLDLGYDEIYVVSICKDSGLSYEQAYFFPIQTIPDEESDMSVSYWKQNGQKGIAIQFNSSSNLYNTDYLRLNYKKSGMAGFKRDWSDTFEQLSNLYRS
jgi:hypothetical protein